MNNIDLILPTLDLKVTWFTLPSWIDIKSLYAILIRNEDPVEGFCCRVLKLSLKAYWSAGQVGKISDEISIFKMIK